MSLYFAYGSNMDQGQMKERCPGAELLGPAALPGYRAAFTIFSPKRLCGCADIVSSEGDAVYGLLYRLSEEEMRRMDEFEGHPLHYQRITVRVVDGEGEEREAETYEVVEKKEGLAPSAHYLGLMREAAAKFRFPEGYQEFLRNTQTCA